MPGDKKIPLSEWQNATLPERTRLYFAYGGHSYAAQAAFWNDWQKAFHFFVLAHVEGY